MSINIAIVGTGNVARSNYLPYLASQQDVNLFYYNRTHSKAEACARDFGGQAVHSVREVLERHPDAVLVLTREDQRYEVALELLEGHPRRLFFEKPLVAQNGQANVCEDDFVKAREVLQKARAAGTETAMVFNYRFFDQTQRALDIVRDRDFGPMTQASLFVNYACWSHCIDLLHLFGGPAAHITALASQVEYKDAVDVAAAFELVTGATGIILGTSGSQFAFPLYDMLFNYGPGSLRFTDLDVGLTVMHTESRHTESHNLTGNHSRWDQYRTSFEKSLAAYLDSIRHEAPPPIPGLAGLQELQFEAALRRSIAQKRPVNVQQEFPLNP